MMSCPKKKVMQEYLDIERSKLPDESQSRRPTLALRLALSIFGGHPQLGYIPRRFFAEQDIQIYVGLPTHPLNQLVQITGETTARKIVQAVYPRLQDMSLSFEARYLPDDSLPTELQSWLMRVSSIVYKVKVQGWDPPLINALHFRQGDNIPWILRAEHLCGQIPDGSHRVLANTILAREDPDSLVRIRILSIHPVVLAILNSLTLPLRFCLDPAGTPNFIQKRFKGSANFLSQITAVKNE